MKKRNKGKQAAQPSAQPSMAISAPAPVQDLERELESVFYKGRIDQIRDALIEPLQYNVGGDIFPLAKQGGESVVSASKYSARQHYESICHALQLQNSTIISDLYGAEHDLEALSQKCLSCNDDGSYLLARIFVDRGGYVEVDGPVLENNAKYDGLRFRLPDLEIGKPTYGELNFSQSSMSLRSLQDFISSKYYWYDQNRQIGFVTPTIQDWRVAGVVQTRSRDKRPSQPFMFRCMTGVMPNAGINLYRRDGVGVVIDPQHPSTFITHCAERNMFSYVISDPQRNHKFFRDFQKMQSPQEIVRRQSIGITQEASNVNSRYFATENQSHGENLGNYSDAAVIGILVQDDSLETMKNAALLRRAYYPNRPFIRYNAMTHQFEHLADEMVFAMSGQEAQRSIQIIHKIKAELTRLAGSDSKLGVTESLIDDVILLKIDFTHVPQYLRHLIELQIPDRMGFVADGPKVIELELEQWNILLKQWQEISATDNIEDSIKLSAGIKIQPRMRGLIEVCSRIPQESINAALPAYKFPHPTDKEVVCYAYMYNGRRRVEFCNMLTGEYIADALPFMIGNDRNNLLKSIHELTPAPLPPSKQQLVSLRVYFDHNRGELKASFMCYNSGATSDLRDYLVNLGVDPREFAQYPGDDKIFYINLKRIAGTGRNWIVTFAGNQDILKMNAKDLELTLGTGSVEVQEIEISPDSEYPITFAINLQQTGRRDIYTYTMPLCFDLGQSAFLKSNYFSIDSIGAQRVSIDEGVNYLTDSFPGIIRLNKGSSSILELSGVSEIESFTNCLRDQNCAIEYLSFQDDVMTFPSKLLTMIFPVIERHAISRHEFLEGERKMDELKGGLAKKLEDFFGYKIINVSDINHDNYEVLNRLIGTEEVNINDHKLCALISFDVNIGQREYELNLTELLLLASENVIIRNGQIIVFTSEDLEGMNVAINKINIDDMGVEGRIDLATVILLERQEAISKLIGEDTYNEMRLSIENAQEWSPLRGVDMKDIDKGKGEESGDQDAHSGDVELVEVRPGTSGASARARGAAADDSSEESSSIEDGYAAPSTSRNAARTLRQEPSLQEKYNQLVQENARLTKENARLEQENKSLGSEMKTLKKNLRDREIDILDFRRQVAELTNALKNDQRPSASTNVARQQDRNQARDRDGGCCTIS